MNEFVIGIQNSSNTLRTSVIVQADYWYDAIEKVMGQHLWAGYAIVLAQNGKKFDLSGKLYI